MTAAQHVGHGISSTFQRGDLVRLRAEPHRQGAIIDGPDFHPSGAEYCVYIDQVSAWYAESQLERVVVTQEPRWVTRDDLIRELTLAKLRKPLSDALYSYRSSRTEFQAYQFRPALKFLRNPHQRILIADEVGLGKTIEAAIIYLELKARLDITRILVLCPSRLTSKWQEELRNRFDEDFQVLNSEKLDRLFNDYRRVGQSLPFRAIASFESMRRAGIAEEFADLGISLDLLIVDEAHYMRNEEARTYRLGATLVNAADAVVFLTATPLHLRNRDLFNLLKLLAPDEFDNPHVFDEHVRPNEIISRTSKLVASGKYVEAAQNLRSVEWTLQKNRFQGNPIYKETIRRLSECAASTLPISTEQRVAIQWDLTELNTLSNVLSRTRNREVTTRAVRAPYILRIALTPAERAFYNAILEQTRQELRRAKPGAPGFASIMKERQAATCLAAMRERLDDASKHGGRFLADVDTSTFEIHEGETESHQPSSHSLHQLSRAIGDADSKFVKFQSILQESLASSPTSKILVFSFFKGTLRYLYRRLKELGFGVATIHGDVAVADRRRIIDHFANESDIRVLLSSEVGAEGLDFQFCDVLINYDLPWNPMQVEQRIGRLDRFGQKHERIRIFNFFIEDTIETRIFERLYQRIKIFEQSIGDLEGILGEEIAKISREALQGNLTPQEESRLADQAAMRIVRHQREEAELERHKDEFIGQGQILDQKVEHTISSGRYVSDNEVRALVGTFLRKVFPRARMEFDAHEPCLTLEFDSALASYLGSHMERNRLAHRVSDRFRTAMSERRKIALTFDSDLARQRPLLEFITIRHPLADAAVAYWKKQTATGIPASLIEIDGPLQEVGLGHFFIYLLEVGGVSTSTTLEPVIVRSDGALAHQSARSLLNAVQHSTALPTDMPKRNDEFLNAERVAARWIASHRNDIESDIRRRNDSLLAARKASLQASFSAKIRRVDTLLSNATDERIQRMRRSELHNLRSKLDVKLAALNEQRDVSVSSSLIAGGVVRISSAS